MLTQRMVGEPRYLDLALEEVGQAYAFSIMPCLLPTQAWMVAKALRGGSK